MAYSIDTHTGDGTTTDYTLSFPYIHKSHVKVIRIDGTVLPYTWLANDKIRMHTAVSSGKLFYICRLTPGATPMGTHVDGQILDKAALEQNYLQTYYVGQEHIDWSNMAASNAATESGKAATKAVNAADSASAAAISAESAAQSQADTASKYNDIAQAYVDMAAALQSTTDLKNETAGYRTEAKGYRDEAKTHRDFTLAFRNAADSYRQAAEAAQAAAETAQADADIAKNAAVTAKTATEDARDTASQYLIDEATKQIDLIQTEGTTQKAAMTDHGTAVINGVITETATQKDLVTTEGTTQVNGVISEGSNQVGAVTAEGTAQKDSINAYTDGKKAALTTHTNTKLGEITSHTDAKKTEITTYTTTQKGAVTTEGNAQVSRVSSEGSTQVSAVQAKVDALASRTSLRQTVLAGPTPEFYNADRWLRFYATSSNPLVVSIAKGFNSEGQVDKVVYITNTVTISDLNGSNSAAGKRWIYVREDGVVGVSGEMPKYVWGDPVTTGWCFSISRMKMYYNNLETPAVFICEYNVNASNVGVDLWIYPYTDKAETPEVALPGNTVLDMTNLFGHEWVKMTVMQKNPDNSGYMEVPIGRSGTDTYGITFSVLPDKMRVTTGKQPLMYFGASGTYQTATTSPFKVQMVRMF